jgi:DNA-binding PadR family transcriptional regulator
MSRPSRLTYPTALVLQAVAEGFRYGFDIIDVSGLASGTVYPILRRLEESGLLRSRWEAVQAARDDQRPPRRYYQVTGSGAAMAREAVERYPGLSAAFSRRAGKPAPSPA